MPDSIKEEEIIVTAKRSPDATVGNNGFSLTSMADDVMEFVDPFSDIGGQETVQSFNLFPEVVHIEGYSFRIRISPADMQRMSAEQRGARDVNGNGKSSPRELMSLTEAGIAQISLEKLTSNALDLGFRDNQILATTAFTRTDGSAGLAGDVALFGGDCGCSGGSSVLAWRGGAAANLQDWPAAIA